jgi:hypothetical protein
VCRGDALLFRLLISPPRPYPIYACVFCARAVCEPRGRGRLGGEWSYAAWRARCLGAWVGRSECVAFVRVLRGPSLTHAFALQH